MSPLQQLGRAAGLALVASTLGASEAMGQAPLSFERYRETVEPIFLEDRGGWGPGRAPCVTCHAEQGTPLRLQRLRETDDGEVYWAEEDSRRNFEVVSRLVTPGDPDGSRLLRKALEVPAGGAAFHVGGKFFESKSDPEWRAMADWVAAADPAERPAPPRLDFDFFRDCVQRMYLDKRPGDVECIHCHETGARGFARHIPEDRDFWNQEESRGNFAVTRRYVEPGEPMMSRLLTHPLAPTAGGDYFHGGPRRWDSTDDPEWQMLAAWVRGETPECVVGQEADSGGG
ncbi:hypothetical protein [Candidatus Palauibacter sp.]|uniref:hypothetical protein n=1 Tax=Candidatus Palauibacter sp. TaxID=3101350 RepID=UPI003B521BF1